MNTFKTTPLYSEHLP